MVEHRGQIAHHVAGPLLTVMVAPGRHTVLCVAIAEATAFDDEIVDGIVVCGQGAGMFGLAGARLALQQPDSQVGDHELILGSRSIGIHGVPR